MPVSGGFVGGHIKERLCYVCVSELHLLFAVLGLQLFQRGRDCLGDGELRMGCNICRGGWLILQINLTLMVGSFRTECI